MKRENRNQLNEWLRTGAPNMIIVLVGIAFFVALEHLDVVRALVGRVLDVCMPFLLGGALAFLLDGPVRYLTRKFHWKRTPTVWLVFLATVLFVVLLFVGFIPQLVDSITQLVMQIPTYLDGLTGFVDWLGEKYPIDVTGLRELLGSYSMLIEQAAGYVSDALPQILNYSLKIGNGVLQGVEAIMATMYILLSKDSLLRQMKKLNYAIFPRPVADRFRRIYHHVCRSFTGFFNGKLVDSLIIGLISFVVLTILGMPYVILLSVVIGVTNIIPFFGPFIGAIPNTMILLIIDPIKALEYVIFTLILQQFDGNVLGPRILGDNIGLPPLWVLVSIVVAGGLFGFAGMVLGVPLFAVFYALLKEWTNERLAEKQIDAAGKTDPAAAETPPRP